MALNGLGVEIGAGPKGELGVDSTVLGLMQRTVTLEEKVSQLFELLRDPVYLYLTAVLGNSAEAEDITQETFLRLYRALHRGQVINNVRFWLFRVAHNLAFDHSSRYDAKSRVTRCFAGVSHPDFFLFGRIWPYARRADFFGHAFGNKCLAWFSI